ncbi:MAG: hypothetical protein GWP08_11275 [Nitrospiraceae bacterium]|nr:hypothetical protein [Nitrospiraceae bacterium]
MLFRNPSILRTAALIAMLPSALGYAFAMESGIHEDAASVMLEADGGLRLHLDRATGAGLKLEAGGASLDLGKTALFRFEEVVESPDAENLLEGMTAEAWGMPADAGAEDGWLRVDGAGTARPKRGLALNQSEPGPLVLSGRCRLDAGGKALGWVSRNLAVNAACVYTDGTRMPEQSAYFGQYQHGPQQSRGVVCPDKPIARVDFNLTVPTPESTAWYSNVRLTQAAYRDVPVRGAIERIGYQALQEFGDEAAGLKGLASYMLRGNGIEARCRFASTTDAERGVSVYFALPVDAVGGVWYDHARASRTIQAGQLYRDGFWYGAGRDGYNNRYPMACLVTKDGTGLALATAMDEPTVFQTEYDAARREFRIRFDVGVSPAAGRWANRGEVSAYLYTFDAKDGFRGAAAGYCAMFPASFERRCEVQGLWLPFLSPRRVAGSNEEFQFQFLETVSDMGWAERQGMYSLRYAEPWILHQEMPPTVKADEVHGPATPQVALDLAKRLSEWDGPVLPLDMRRRYPAYGDNRVLDTWGEPLGYFFRDPAGRNENMMMVNPGAALPASPGAHMPIGGWDREIIREVGTVRKQWYVPGWTLVRVAAHPFFNIDTAKKASGNQSARFDPAQGKSYFEQYLRGIAQEFYYEGDSAGPFTLSFQARAEQAPPGGARFPWRVMYWYEDGTQQVESFEASGLDEAWRRFEFASTPRRTPKAILVEARTGVWTPDPATVWMDDMSLVAEGNPANLLTNGGFEEAELLPCEVDGVYLDTLECYEAYFNYDRSHWAFADAPLTFDWGRRPAIHQVFSHIAFAKELARDLRPAGKLLFGNCAPRTSFAAHWLDVLGDEQFWKLGETWQPPEDAEMSFARFMCGTKPFCLLQYGDLNAEEQERYLKRSLFYAALPSNQLGWYWANPVGVAGHREAFKRYVPTIVKLADAGWEPLTLASSDNPKIWLERYGDGDTFYITCFNADPGTEQAVVSFDPRAGLDAESSATVLVAGAGCEWRNEEGAPRIRVTLGPEDVAAVAIVR